MSERCPAGVKGKLTAEDGEVGGGRVAIGWQAGRMVLVDEDHLAGVYCIYDLDAPSSRAVVLCGGEPRAVMGIEVAHNDDVGVLLLEEMGEVW